MIQWKFLSDAHKSTFICLNKAILLVSALNMNDSVRMFKWVNKEYCLCHPFLSLAQMFLFKLNEQHITGKASNWLIMLKEWLNYTFRWAVLLSRHFFSKVTSVSVLHWAKPPFPKKELTCDQEGISESRYVHIDCQYDYQNKSRKQLKKYNMSLLQVSYKECLKLWWPGSS